MQKYFRIRNLSVLILFCFLFVSCSKQEMPYDLFPLEVGNEFYYSYYKYRYSGISSYTTGTENWKVISVSEADGSFKYRIERNLNALFTYAGHTDTITDSKSYLEVIEDKSSSVISVFGFSFNRYQDVAEIELKQEGNTSMPSLTCSFKADTGMISYSYYHPPNQIVNETLTLDSLKINL